MIDPSLFDVKRLLDVMLDDQFGNRDVWRKQAEIVVGYMPPFPRPETQPSVVVRFEDSFLRHSRGPRQGCFWDLGGDNFQTPELALLALMQAPVPPGALHSRIWTKHRSAR